MVFGNEMFATIGSKYDIGFALSKAFMCKVETPELKGDIDTLFGMKLTFRSLSLALLVVLFREASDGRCVLPFITNSTSLSSPCLKTIEEFGDVDIVNSGGGIILQPVISINLQKTMFLHKIVCDVNKSGRICIHYRLGARLNPHELKLIDKRLSMSGLIANYIGVGSVPDNIDGPYDKVFVHLHLSQLSETPSLEEVV
jgi:hypothetical protein